ncbi:MAG: TRAP transporter TatT component family protein [Calditrichaceae bacterium]
MYIRIFYIASCFIISLTLTHCFTYSPDWQVSEPVDKETSIDSLLQKADNLVKKVDTREKLMDIIRIYEDILQTDPQNYKALYELGHLYLLAGDGYSTKTSEKKDFFKKALYYNEHAMYTNPLFKKQIEAGADVWEAAKVLEEKDMDLMLFWTTAVFYYYKECLGAFGQMINYHWIRKAKSMMELLYDINPEHAGGAPYFTKALYYLSIPRSVGGNKKIAEDLFAKAIEVGPDWLLNRWGRAKYFYVKMQNREAFKRDLEWILKQDIDKMKGHPAWKIYFMNDAKNMLTYIDDYF